MMYFIFLNQYSCRQISICLEMAFRFVHTAAVFDLWAQHIFNFCAH
jgi:hypothetical protein